MKILVEIISAIMSIFVIPLIAIALFARIVLKLVFACVLLSACSSATYTRINTDGSKVIVSGWELGTDKALGGFSYDGDGKGAVKVDIDSLDSNQTNGLKQLNGLVQAIVSGAVQGAK